MDKDVIERAGDKDFYRARDAHQAAIDFYEVRKKLVQECAEYLMRPGEKYDPRHYGNFLEALSNSPDSAQKFLWTFYVEAANQKFRNDTTNHTAVYALHTMVYEYWHAIAVAEADKMIEG